MATPLNVNTYNIFTFELKWKCIGPFGKRCAAAKHLFKLRCACRVCMLLRALCFFCPYYFSPFYLPTRQRIGICTVHVFIHIEQKKRNKKIRNKKKKLEKNIKGKYVICENSASKHTFSRSIAVWWLRVVQCTNSEFLHISICDNTKCIPYALVVHHAFVRPNAKSHEFLVSRRNFEYMHVEDMWHKQTSDCIDVDV